MLNKNFKSFYIFLWQNFKLAALALILGSALVYISADLHAKNLQWPSNLTLSLGVGAFLFGAINIVYEISVRKSYLSLFEKINSSVSSGITMHKTHNESSLISRYDAISNFIGKNDEIRLMVSNGHKYVTPGESPYKAICAKLEQGASLKILLYNSFQKDHIKSKVKYARSYENIDEIRKTQFNCMEKYNDLYEKYGTNVDIKFFRHRMYMSYLCIDSKVLYGALVFHLVSPAALKSEVDPCFEIENLGTNSLFSLIYKDFDKVFSDKSSIDFADIYKLYRENIDDCNNFWNAACDFVVNNKSQDRKK